MIAFQFQGSNPPNQVPGPGPSMMMPGGPQMQNQRYYPPQQQQQMAQQQRLQHPHAQQVPSVQQSMMHSMAYQQQHLVQQQMQQMVQPPPQMHNQNYANQMAYMQRQQAYRPRPPGPQHQQGYQQMFQHQQQAGMMMGNLPPQTANMNMNASNCEVTARVPHNSGSYGVIRVSAQQPLMNQGPHFMKCQSWTPPQVTPNSMQGTSRPFPDCFMLFDQRKM